MCPVKLLSKYCVEYMKWELQVAVYSISYEQTVIATTVTCLEYCSGAVDLITCLNCSCE